MLQDKSHQTTLAAIACMTLAMANFALMSNVVRLAAQEIPSAQLVFMRNIMALILVSACILPRGLAGLRTRRIWSHVWRAVMGAVTMQLWFYSLTILPINTAIALSFTSPVFVSLLAIMMLKESPNLSRLLAIAAGFLGTWMILRPGADFLDLGMHGPAMALLASALLAFVSIWIKTLSRTESTAAMMFYVALFMTPMSLPLAWHVWQTPSWHVLSLTLIIAATSTFAHICLIAAFRRAPMSLLMPFDFLRLLFAAAIAYPLFGERLDEWTLLGSLVILAAAVTTVLAGSPRLRKTTSQAEQTDIKE